MLDKNSQKTVQYIVHHQGEALGPFDINFIEAMVMSGVYPTSLTVENPNTKERILYSSIVSTAQDRSSPEGRSGARQQKPRSDSRKPSKNKAETALIGVSSLIGVLFFVWIISLFKPALSSSKGSAAATEPTSEKSSYSPRKKTSSNNIDSTSQPTSKPSARPSSKPSSKRTASSYSKPKATPPPVDTVLYRDASGRTYRVSDSDYYRLQGMSSSLVLKSVRLEREKSRLNSMSIEVDNDRSGLNRSSQYQVDSFNSKVDRLNSKNSEVQSLVDGYNRDVNSFNRELERVGTLIR